MARFWKMLFLGSLCYLTLTLLLFPTKTVAAAQSAIYLCLDVVIPSLFPFLVCSHLFLSLGVATLLSRIFSPMMRPLFGVPGCGALAAVLGVVSGYPVGASCIANLYSAGHCTKDEAHRLLTFCSNAGPLFILGAIGAGMLKNPACGFLLYFSHLLSAFLVGLICRPGNRTTQIQAPLTLPPSVGRQNLTAAIGQGIADSVDTMLKICGFVILFAVFSAGLPPTALTPFLYGVLEITGGIRAIIESGIVPVSFLLPTLSFFLALSGISVLLQTASIILPVGLSLKPYLFGKFLQGVLSFFITFLFCRVSPIPVPTTLFFSPWKIPSPKELFGMASAFLLFLSAAFLFLWLIYFFHKKRDH